jgi:molecular chaperone GrpE (heat shock protein)
MSKKDKKTNQDLQKKLEEVIKEKEEQKENEATDLDDIQLLKTEIAKLEKEKIELTEMAKRAQYDYINLKVDFDRFVRQTQEKNKTIAVDYLIEVVKKFLPFIENLRKSLDNVAQSSKLNPELSQNPITK